VVIKNDGTAISWGQTAYMHGYSGPYTNVREAHCGGYLCVALKNDGSVVSWGPHWYNQDNRFSTLVSQGHLSSDIAKVQCGISACLAVKSDGRVFTWGHRKFGGDSRNVDLTNMALDFPCESSTAASAESADCALRESDDIFVKRAVMCGGEACVAIKNDEQRTAVVWGRVNMHEGSHAGDISTVDLTNVAQATCGYWECAVLKTDGSAQAWGQDYYNNGADALNLPDRRDITMIDCGHSSCVALTSNGDALFWGGEAYMGDLAPGSSVTGYNFVDAGCGASACWAMKPDSSVMTWGMRQDNIPEGALTDVKKVQCGGSKCVSISNQGRLYTWGSRGYGGDLEPRNVGDATIADAMCGPYVCIAVSDQGEVFTWGSWHQLPNRAPATATDVASAHCGYGACVVIKNDGTAISWGQTAYMHGYSGPYTNVREAHCGGYLCVALKNDGSVVSWGPHWYNQDNRFSTLVSQGHLSSDIAKVQCGISACLAVKSDGRVFTWGHRKFGGDSRNVDLTNMALDFPCESSTAGRRVLKSQQLDDYSVAEQHALLNRLLRL